MITVTQGRVIPETDKERAAAGLNKFQAEVGPPMLDLMTWMVTNRRSGILWIHLQLKEGELARYSLEIKCNEEFGNSPARGKGDAEREVQRFTSKASGEIMKTLSDAIVRRESGWVHPHLKIQDGKLTWLQYATDFGKALDECNGD